jgi:hypothetical protein
MATDPSTRNDTLPAAAPGARVFTVRLWKEELAGGREYRGSVRDVVSGRSTGFRDWSDLIAFMAARLEHEEDR